MSNNPLFWGMFPRATPPPERPTAPRAASSVQPPTPPALSPQRPSGDYILEPSKQGVPAEHRDGGFLYRHHEQPEYGVLIPTPEKGFPHGAVPPDVVHVEGKSSFLRYRDDPKTYIYEATNGAVVPLSEQKEAARPVASSPQPPPLN